MDEPKRLEDIASEISGALDVLTTSLREALVEAEHYHSDHDLDPADDPSFMSSLVRRFVRARATAAMPGVIDPASNMSPVFLHLGPYKLRVLHVHDGGLPPAQSHARKEYYSFNDQGIQALNVWSADAVVDLEESTSVVPEFNLVLLWDADGASLTEATLVRPWVSTPSESLGLLTAEVTERDLDEIVKRADNTSTSRKVVNDPAEAVEPTVSPNDQEEEGDPDEDLEL